MQTVQNPIDPKKGILGPAPDCPAHITSFLNREKFTGTFQIDRDHLFIRIFFKNGDVFFAESNNPADRIGSLLLQDGLVTTEQLKDALIISKDENIRLGESLIAMKILQPHQLFESVQKQVKMLYFKALGWESGTYSYWPGNPKESETISLQTNFSSLFKEAVQHAYTEVRAMGCLKSYDRVLKPRQDYIERLGSLKLNGPEQKTANLVDGLRTIQDLLDMSSLPAEETVLLLYVLYSFDICYYENDSH